MVSTLISLMVRRAGLLLFYVLLIGLVSAGPFGESNVTVIVDGDAPVINIISPSPINYGEGVPILVDYSVSDQSSVSSVWYWLNGSNNITIFGPFSLNLGKGNYTLRIYANDSLGNKGFSQVIFSIDNATEFCGNGFCSNPAGEFCDVCLADCLACTIPPGDGGAGGGGGGGIKPKAGNVSSNDTTGDNGENLTHFELSDGLSFADIGVGED